MTVFFFFGTVPVFKVHDRPIFNVAPFERLSAMNVVSAMGLGFLLALLIFIDQNIVVSLTNAPENRYRSDTPRRVLQAINVIICLYFKGLHA